MKLITKKYIELIKESKGEGIISSLAAMIMIIGCLTLLITWFVLNVNNFQLQTALNLSLKKAQVEGYLSNENITQTTSYLNSVGLSSVIITSPQKVPMGYGSEIQVTIIASTMPLPTMDSEGHAVSDDSRSDSLTGTGYIISQYVP